MKMKWIPEYNTGIDVIDDQHRRILDYINEIDEIGVNTDRQRIKDILNNRSLAKVIIENLSGLPVQRLS